MILLLALGIAFAFYTLTFIATQQQRVYDAAAYSVGADFSGPASPPAQTQTLSQQTATYLHTAGVTSATLGYQGTLFSTSSHPQAILHLLLCWFFLAAMILILGLLTAFFLKRKDVRT